MSQSRVLIFFDCESLSNETAVCEVSLLVIDMVQGTVLFTFHAIVHPDSCLVGTSYCRTYKIHGLGRGVTQKFGKSELWVQKKVRAIQVRFPEALWMAANPGSLDAKVLKRWGIQEQVHDFWPVASHCASRWGGITQDLTPKKNRRKEWRNAAESMRCRCHLWLNERKIQTIKPKDGFFHCSLVDVYEMWKALEWMGHQRFVRSSSQDEIIAELDQAFVSCWQVPNNKSAPPPQQRRRRRRHW